MKYECDKCKKKLSSRSSLIRHIHSAHAEKKKYLCNICSQYYSRSDVLLRHITRIHSMYKKISYLKICVLQFRMYKEVYTE